MKNEQSKCKNCKKVIYFNGKKWMTNIRKSNSWKCEPTKEFPVKSHQPEFISWDLALDGSY